MLERLPSWLSFGTSLQRNYNSINVHRYSRNSLGTAVFFLLVTLSTAACRTQGPTTSSSKDVFTPSEEGRVLEDFAVSLETQQGILTASFSPDGKRVITGGFMNAAIWDASDGKEIFKLKGLEDYVSQTLFSHDGKKVVTGSLDGSAIIWDAASGKQIVVLKKVSMMKGTNRAVTALSLNPDDTMAVIRSGGLIGLWDVALGKNIKSDGYGMNTVWAASFTPSGIKFIGGTGGRTASIYTFYSNDHFIGPLNGHTDSIRSADFSHDGTKVVTGSDDSTAKIWNASSGTEILTLKGHDRFVSAASFSSDGTKVITGSGDNTAKIWDTVSGKQILTLKGHKGKILTVSFSPDGSKVVTASEDRTAKIWDIKGVMQSGL